MLKHVHHSLCSARCKANCLARKYTRERQCSNTVNILGAIKGFTHRTLINTARKWTKQQARMNCRIGINRFDGINERGRCCVAFLKHETSHRTVARISSFIKRTLIRECRWIIANTNARKCRRNRKRTCGHCSYVVKRASSRRTKQQLSHYELPFIYARTRAATSSLRGT